MKTINLKTLALLLTVALPASAQQKQPISHDALWRMPRVGAPALSPDGQWAVFSVLEPAYKSADNVSDLWIVKTDGSAPARRLTSSKGGESGVAWSPDGKRIAFVAKREGDEFNQIYLLDVSGGEAVRFSNVATGARAPRWRPDGNALLFTSSVYPGAASDTANKRIAKERKDRGYNARVYDTFPIRDFDHWLTDTQPHLFVQSTDAGASARDLLAGTQLVGAIGYAGSSADDINAAWTPDGRSIVFTAQSTRNRSAFSDSPTHLYVIDASGGEPRAITSDSASYASVQFSKDGRTLYARRTAGGYVTYSHDRLASFSWPNVGAPNVLTANIDKSINDYDIAPDGKSFFLTVSEAGRTRIYRMPIGGGALTPLRAEPVGSYGGLDVAGPASAPVLVAQWQSAIRPPEIVRVDVANGTHRELTSITTAKVVALDLPPLREFWFTAKNGRRIHNFVALPPNFDENKKYPLFVVMHGGPHSAWMDEWGLRWHYHLLARPGYIVLLTDYSGSTGYSEAFARAIQNDPLKGPAQEINEAADEAIRLYPFIDASRQAAGGASYGGHLAYWQLATTDRYKALIAHAGAINPESQWGTSDVIWHREVMFGGPIWEQGNVWREQNAMRFASKFKTPTLLTVGELDYRVPINNTLEAWAALQRMQVPSRLIVFPDQNHWIMGGEDSRFFYSEVHAWLEKYLRN